MANSNNDNTKKGKLYKRGLDNVVVVCFICYTRYVCDARQLVENREISLFRLYLVLVEYINRFYVYKYNICIYRNKCVVCRCCLTRLVLHFAAYFYSPSRHSTFLTRPVKTMSSSCFLVESLNKRGATKEDVPSIIIPVVYRL